ncbi:MAG TPA: glycerol-3-phosphate acyltransferase [Candidatus Binatia bacterium]|nr:glycerol-3-phosphate acyltransferase [Candidatus Binatia bacterium]
MRLASVAALGYAMGSIPVGVVAGRLSRGIDVREHGSHSMGMANVLRTAGRGPAAATLALDIAKGAAAARLGKALAGNAGGVVAGLGAIVGHSWPVFAGFRGGKSSATTFGAAIVMAPEAAGVALASGLAALAVSRRTSVLSLTGSGAAVVAAIGLAVRRHDLTSLALVGPGVAIVVLRHHENINRLLRGVEPEVSLAEPAPTAATA